MINQTLADRLIGLSEVIELVKLSRSSIYEMIGQNAFPASVQRVDGSGRLIRVKTWRHSDIQKYIAALPVAEK